MEQYNSYTWTTGADATLEHKRRIASGGSGDVHEIFARKLLHLFRIDSAPIQNEIRAIRKLCNGANENIIKVFSIGEFPDRTYAFIDMELCDIDLHEYNKGSWSVGLVQDYGPDARAAQLWRIMMQIAKALVFIHGNNEVHRDLKPRNVLYSRNDTTWKVADFGLTSEGSSHSWHKTKDARGTPGYRSPEFLVNGDPIYNNKVDIWALGCILHELACGHKPFGSDLAVAEHYRARLPFAIALPDIWDARMKTALRGSIKAMLQREPSSRPSASDLLRYFSNFESTSVDDVSTASITLPITEPLETEEWASYRVSSATPTRVDTGVSGITWICSETVVSPRNGWVATVSYDDDRRTSRVTLWSASGEVIWEEFDSWDGDLHVSPTFSEDGNFLGVYSTDSVKVLEAQSAKLVHQCRFPENVSVSSISIARRGKGIAVSTHTELEATIVQSSEEITATVSGNEALNLLERTTKLSRERFPTENPDAPTRFVDVIVTSLSNVAVRYLSEGRRLFVYGQSQYPPSHMWGWWDTESRAIRGPVIEPLYRWYRSGPLRGFNLAGEAGLAFGGIWSGSKFRSFFTVYRVDGLWVGDYRAAEIALGTLRDGSAALLAVGTLEREADDTNSWMPLPAIPPPGLGQFTSQTAVVYLWKWEGSNNVPKTVGILSGADVPPIHLVKGFTETTDGGLTLILGDERTVFLKRETN